MHVPTTTIFKRLLLYFVVVMVIPLAILIISYFYYTQSNIKKILENQTIKAIENDTKNLEEILEEYKSMAWILAENTDIINALKTDEISKEEMRSIYVLLFSETGIFDTKAQASIVSASGNIQLSSGTFPPQYDLNVYKNDTIDSNIIEKARKAEEADTLRDIYISIADSTATGDKNQTFMTILRRVISNEQTVGYVIIEIFFDMINSNINTSSIFHEEVLVDNENKMAISLLHPSKYALLSTFQNLYADNLITVERPLADGSFSIIANTDIRPYKTNISSSVLFFVIAMSIGLLISVGFALLFSHSFAMRVKTIIDAMSKIQKGNLDARSNENTGLFEFDKLAIAFNKMTDELSSLIALTKEEEEKLAEAERKELEKQLNPHFLFNTLNTIKALAKLHGEDEIYTISIRLGKILRSSLNNRDSECTIEESVNLVESYLIIQKIRFKDKISYSLNVDDSILNVKTPKLIIQPLVENSIIHGLEPKTEAGRLDINIRDNEDRIEIEIIDDGIGFEPKDLKELQENGHVGLYNVIRRLELKYSYSLVFSITSKKEKGTRISISFPKKAETNNMETI